MRVLVVDDDRDNAELVAELVGLQGHQTTLGFDGESAIALARELVPDIALLDISLPDMDGYELARRLRGEPALAHVVLVSLTGWSGAEYALESRRAGFDHHLVKPIKFDELQRILGQ